MTAKGQYRVVLVTCRNLGESRRIAKALVAKRFAACVSIVRSPVESTYRWKARIETAREHLLLVKTTGARLKDVVREVQRLHRYEVPEVIALPVAGGLGRYLAWLAGSVKG